ncbi:alpha/beta hydrolase [Mucilaginibacter flavus]|uniref:alpha/beta hydrolase n=1 Tax=Mucilaginibacter flavus TaxID=931504 RepID=UPI0025B366F2|nr:alpha/beta hydrolase [Mucilaginibacter flavus]MDN3580681.1 alpha/beta hydrolase [Mucilaginibacter flavus]
MKKQILFIQGGGDDGYTADLKLVDSLKKELGDTYNISYPKLQTDESLPDFGWLKQISEEVGKLKNEVIIVAHSLGASLLLKYLSEYEASKQLAGIFLLSTPFWSGDEDWKQGLKLRDDFAEKLPENTPLFFYQAHDDEEVPFKHFETYRQKLPAATFREINKGGHQLGNNLSLVARDIKNL